MGFLKQYYYYYFNKSQIYKIHRTTTLLLLAATKRYSLLPAATKRAGRCRRQRRAAVRCRLQQQLHVPYSCVAPYRSSCLLSIRNKLDCFSKSMCMCCSESMLACTRESVKVVCMLLVREHRWASFCMYSCVWSMAKTAGSAWACPTLTSSGKIIHRFSPRTPTSTTKTFDSAREPRHPQPKPSIQPEPDQPWHPLPKSWVQLPNPHALELDSTFVPSMDMNPMLPQIMVHAAKCNNRTRDNV